MTLLLVNKEDLYHFRNIDDMELWIGEHGHDQEIIVIADDEYNEEFQEFLDDNAPLIITEK